MGLHSWPCRRITACSWRTWLRFLDLSSKNASFSGVGRWLDGGERLGGRLIGGADGWEVNRGEEDMSFVR